MKLFTAKVGSVGLETLLVAGGTKYFEERMLAPYIGNGTLFSGAAKVGVGMMLPQVAGNGKYPNAMALGFGIDGVEDLLQALLGGSLGQNALGTQETVL